MTFTTPPYAQPRGIEIDTNPLSAGIKNFGNALMRDFKREEDRQLGEAARSGDLQGFADKAFELGRVQEGMTGLQRIDQRKERARVAARQKAQDIESKRRFDLQQDWRERQLEVQKRYLQSSGRSSADICTAGNQHSCRFPGRQALFDDWPTIGWAW